MYIEYTYKIYKIYFKNYILSEKLFLIIKKYF